MIQTNSILSELQEKISRYDFEKVVNEHNGDKGIRRFSTKNSFPVLLYFHISGKQSIRDLILSLKSKNNFWYHLGLKTISRNNLSYAMMKRSNEIFEKTFYLLLNKFMKSKGLSKDKRFKFKNPLKAIDSSTISLCLNLFDWAKFRKSKGGIKLHTVYDIKNQIPEFVNIKNAIRHDSTECKKYPIVKNAIYAMDKGYLNFKFWQKINKTKAFFVTRTKTNTKYKLIKFHEIKNDSIIIDWAVRVTEMKSSEYPEELRVIVYYDKEKDKFYEYITNNFLLAAITIADIYKARWDIELFFKSIKQNLKIKTFLGTSENAVKIQIWVALISYLLIQYIRFKSKTSFSFLNSFRLIKENILTKGLIDELLFAMDKLKSKAPPINNHQLELSF